MWVPVALDMHAKGSGSSKLPFSLLGFQVKYSLSLLLGIITFMYQYVRRFVVMSTF